MAHPHPNPQPQPGRLLPLLPSPLRLIAFATLLACAGPAFAQTPPPSSQANQAPAPKAGLDTVTITGRHSAPAVSGFGDQPLATTPIPATRYSEDDLAEQGVTRLSGLTGLNASVSDAYNTTGYWDYLTVRGFLLDNRFNYRRDGLPVNAETSLPLANKSGVEVLRGSSGIQAGTSAPGGLVNLLVKRPDRELTRFHLGWAEGGRASAQADVSRRLGEAGEFGLRGNLLVERLDTPTENTRGQRHIAALAADWHGPGGSLLEAEVEHSRQRQPSVPGFSLLGERIPSPADPRINLNNQAWSLPVVLQGNTASLRWTLPLEAHWKFIAHGMTQRLTNDDRIAFPYGCTDSSGNWYADRYCPDGSADLYDFRSDNERRRSDALDLGVQGRAQLGGLQHQLATGLLLTRYRQRMQMQAYNWAGTVAVDGSTRVPANPALTQPNTDRDERSSELYLRDAIRLAPRWQAWLGLRHTRLQRESVRTDGSNPSDYSDRFTTPWLALSHEWAPQHIVYASWGRGSESDVVPSRARYTNRGEALLLRSRQAELGVKGQTKGRQWALTLFDIRRGQTAGVGSDCSSDIPGDTCTVVADGVAHHRGLEAELSQQLGPLRLETSALLLRARREGSANPAVNGQRPPNVPAYSAKAAASYTVAGLPGLTLGAAAVHEGGRTLLPTNDQLRIPAWTRLDASAQWQQPLADQRRLTWSAGITNLTNRRAWREAPYQFEHIYLFPLPERSLRLGLQIEL